jgi:predicted phage terminase large subunit-like protein
MSDDDRLILDQDIRWYKLENVIKNKDLFNFYITTDFATSEETAADYSVISVWAVNHNGDWFWVDGVCKRQLMDANINDLFRLAQKYKPQSVGVEVSGQQGGFIQWIQNEMMERNIYFTLASDSNNGKPGIRPVTKKMVRFNIVVPWFKAGKMYFPIELKDTPILVEAIDELSLASPGGFKSKHEDVIDTISMLAQINAWRPSEEAPVSEGSQKDIWDLDIDDEEDDRIYSYIV